MNTTQLQSAARSILCVAALAAASSSAFSQSREYQRGYEAGYRDGVEASQNQGQASNRPGRFILERATYGFRGEVCDATDAVRNAAGGRRWIEVVANNDLCGDAAPNRPKTLTVTYRCGNDGPPQRANVREGTAMRLSCR